MSRILRDLAPPALAAAIEATPIEYWRTCCPRVPRAELHDGPDMTWFVTDIPFAPFNQVIVTCLAGANVHARIDETLAQFRTRHVPMLWSVGPSMRPPDLGSYLEEHGLTTPVALTGMAVDLAALQEDAAMPLGLTIERVGDVEMLEKWGHAYTRGFEMPDFAGRAFSDLYLSVGFDDHVPFRHYVGFLHGEPVASSTLFLAVGVAGIWHVGTVPSARRQGIGAMMTLAPLCDARAMGYRVGTLFASRMGVEVYRRLGFQEYCELIQYQWPGETGD